MEFIKKNQQYKEVSYSERQEEEYLSSTEVESQHGDDEKQAVNAKPDRRRRPRARRSRTSLFVAEFRRFRWLVDVVLLIINISLSVVLLRNFNQENATSTMQVGSSFDGTGPDCENERANVRRPSTDAESSSHQDCQVRGGPGLCTQ